MLSSLTWYTCANNKTEDVLPACQTPHSCIHSSAKQVGIKFRRKGSLSWFIIVKSCTIFKIAMGVFLVGDIHELPKNAEEIVSLCCYTCSE